MKNKAFKRENPKARAFKLKFLDTFNPKEPSEKLMQHLQEVVLPKSGYLNVQDRGQKLLDLELDRIEYIAYRCEQCTAEQVLKSQLVYYIKWWEELELEGDTEDKINFETLFREDFKEYKIDFDSICTSSPEVDVGSLL